MSRRTSDSNKAVREKWAQEKELVSKGQGTRDWIPEQQREILELGRAYYHSDDPNDVNDGKAFEGHHMKSAEKYPEYQGDSGNIQFLTRAEHQEAHCGNFRNPTNGYYDPVEKITYDFGDNIYEPCKIINLSEPICAPIIETNSNVSEEQDVKAKEKSSNTKSSDKKNLNEAVSGINTTRSVQETHKKTQRKASVKKKSVTESILGVGNVVKDFSTRHPVFMGFVESVGAAFAITFFEQMKHNDYIDKNSRQSAGNSIRKEVDYSTPPYSSLNLEKNTDVGSMETESEQKTSHKRGPLLEKQTIRAHEQRYHTNEGIKTIQKAPYSRGGKNVGTDD